MEKLEPLYVAGRNENWYSHCEKVWQFLKKVNTELPYDLLISRYISKRIESKDTNSYLYTKVHKAIILQ